MILNSCMTHSEQLGVYKVVSGKWLVVLSGLWFGLNLNRG